ncbi:MAG: ABC transporter substrate-binding protein, partial [Planctomycetota bacterium]
MRTILGVAVLAILAAAGCGGKPAPGNTGPAQPAGPSAKAGAPANAGADDLSGFTATVVADEHNDRVTDADRGDAPVSGGTVRIRLPSFPAGMNRHIQSHNTEGQVMLSWYLNAELVLMDLETLEWLPYACEYYYTQDVVEKQDGSRILGRIQSRVNGGVTIIEGARRVTLVQAEVQQESKRDGVASVTAPGGDVFTGVVTPGIRYTIDVEDVPAGATPVTVAAADLKPEAWANAGKKQPGIKPNVVHVFKVRTGIRWHDGKPLTAHDVAFTVNDVIKNEHVPTPHLRSYFQDVQECEALDDHTVRYIWAKPYFQSLDYSGRVRIVAKHLYWTDDYEGDPKAFGEDYAKHPLNEAPVGFGPFKLKKWDKQSQVMEYARNDDFFARKLNLPWYAPARPYLDTVQWVVIKEENAAVKGLTSRDIDLDNDVEPDTWKREDTNAAAFTAGFARVTGLVPLYTYIGWNQQREYFKDKRVRKALTMLIPRAQILNEIHHGLGAQTTGPFYVHSPANDPAIQPLPYDPAAAMKLLEAAGFVDRDGDRFLDWRDAQGNVQTLEFEYLVHNAKAYHEKIAVKVKESLEKAGIKVQIRKIDWTIFGKQVQERG